MQKIQNVDWPMSAFNFPQVVGLLDLSPGSVDSVVKWLIFIGQAVHHLWRSKENKPSIDELETPKSLSSFILFYEWS